MHIAFVLTAVVDAMAFATEMRPEVQTSLDSGFRLDAICVRYLNTCSVTLVPVMGSNMPDSSFCPTSNPVGAEQSVSRD